MPQTSKTITSVTPEAIRTDDSGGKYLVSLVTYTAPQERVVLPIETAVPSDGLIDHEWHGSSSHMLEVEVAILPLRRRWRRTTPTTGDPAPRPPVARSRSRTGSGVRRLAQSSRGPCTVTDVGRAVLRESPLRLASDYDEWPRSPTWPTASPWTDGQPPCCGPQISPRERPESWPPAHDPLRSPGRDPGGGGDRARPWQTARWRTCALRRCRGMRTSCEPLPGRCWRMEAS